MDKNSSRKQILTSKQSSRLTPTRFRTRTFRTSCSMSLRPANEFVCKHPFACRSCATKNRDKNATVKSIYIIALQISEGINRGHHTVFIYNLCSVCTHYYDYLAFLKIFITLHTISNVRFKVNDFWSLGTESWDHFYFLATIKYLCMVP